MDTGKLIGVPYKIWEMCQVYVVGEKYVAPLRRPIDSLRIPHKEIWSIYKLQSFRHKLWSSAWSTQNQCQGESHGSSQSAYVLPLLCNRARRRSTAASSVQQVVEIVFRPAQDPCDKGGVTVFILPHTTRQAAGIKHAQCRSLTRGCSCVPGNRSAESNHLARLGGATTLHFLIASLLESLAYRFVCHELREFHSEGSVKYCCRLGGRRLGPPLKKTWRASPFCPFLCFFVYECSWFRYEYMIHTRSPF